MPNRSPAKHAIFAQLRSVRRMINWRRRVRLGVRAVWLALLVWCAGLGANLLGLDLPLVLVGAIVGATLLVAFGYAWSGQIGLSQLARGLDRFYALPQQTMTALELARRGPANTIEQRQVDHTTGWLNKLCRRLQRLPLTPWREVEALVAVALLALGLTIAHGPSMPSPQPRAALPSLPPPMVPPDQLVQASVAPAAALPPSAEESRSALPSAAAQAERPGDTVKPASLPGSETRITPLSADQARGGELSLPANSVGAGVVTTNRGPQGATINIEAGGTGSTTAAPTNNRSEPLPGKAEPLAIPPEYRDVVENYFTPAP